MLIQFPTKSKIRTIVYLSLLISIGVVLNLIEPVQIFPLLPGAKLGLANVSTVLAILLFNGIYGILVAIIRTIVSQVFRGAFNWISFGTSFFGGVSASIVMSVAHYLFRKKMSIEGISALGGIINNVSQVIFVYLVTKNSFFIYYLFFLIPIGGVVGFVVGILSHTVYNRLKLQ
ncbi:Gx transporter family protein [Caldisericum sp. AR60]|uniref:Gx transporter family protein n=1 Tax=Caldisericum sp. AR60 TaxID=3397852 RepID=UPI0039FDC29D